MTDKNVCDNDVAGIPPPPPTSPKSFVKSAATVVVAGSVQVVHPLL